MESRKFSSLMIIFLVVIVSSCDIEEARPPYDSFVNSIPDGGIQIEWNKEQGLLRVNEIENELNSENRVIFSKFLEWYATESNFSFEYLSGKTAKQAVDMINCLKTSAPKEQNKCMTEKST